MKIASPTFKTARSLPARRLVRATVGVVVAVLSGSLASGCRSQTGRTMSEPAGEADPSGSPVAVTGRTWAGLLQVEGGVVSLSVTQGAAGGEDCTAVARADLAPTPGEEVLWRCADPVQPTDTAALALTSGDTLLWTTQEFSRGEVCTPGALLVSVVDALPGAPRELLVRIVACGSSARMMDEDALLAWGPGGMRRVAKATMSCTLARDTSGSGAVVGDGQAWMCSGGYLEVGGQPDAPSVVQVDVALDGLVFAHAERDGDQRLRFSGRGDADPTESAPSDYVQRRRLVWDPVALLYGDGARPLARQGTPVDETHDGSLTTSDTMNSTDSSFQDDFTIQVERGWVITAELSAPAFQPYVWIIAPAHSSAQQLASPPGVHKITLSHVAEESGAYTVRANSNVAGEVGDYTLRITAGPPPAP